MKIEQIHIDGFGHFADKTFGPFNSQVTIFEGENEAGKSTLLAFIRTILYGFPAKNRNEHYPPTRGGEHGGRIMAADDSGERYRIDRHVGPKGGRLKISRDGTLLTDPEAKLRDLLGHASKGQFEHYFAFGLDELTELSSADGDDMQGRLYSASLGAMDLPGVSKTIREDKDGIFLMSGRGGQNQKMTIVLSKLDEVETKLSSHQQDAPKYAELTGRIEQIEQEISGLEAERIELRDVLDRAKILLSIRDDLMEMRILEDQLSELTELPEFPQDSVHRLENCINEAARLEETVLQTTGTIEQLTEKVASRLNGADILEQEESVRESISNLARLEKAVKDLPERQGQASERQSEVTGLLSELGPEWDVSRLDSIDISLPVRDQISQKKDWITTLSQTVAGQRNDEESAETECRTADDAASQAASELDKAGSPTYTEDELAKRRAAINTARSSMGRLSELQLQQAQQPSASRHGADFNGSYPVLGMALVLVLIGIVSTAWGLAGNGGVPAAAMGVLSLVIGLALLIFAYAARKSTSSEVSSGGIESQIGDIQKELHAASEFLGLSSLDSNRLRSVEEEVESENRIWNDLKNLEKTHQDTLRASTQRKDNLNRISNALSESEDRRAEADRDWKEWLTERGLIDTMSPASVLELFSKVGTARSVVSGWNELRSRVSAVQHDIDEIKGLVVPLAHQHGVGVDFEAPSTLIPAIKELSHLLESAQGEANTRTLDEATLAELKNRLEQETRSLKNAQDDLDSLLKLGGTSDTEEFRRIAASQEEFQRIRNELEVYKTTVKKAFIVETDPAALRAEIGDQTKSALEENVQDREQRLQDIELNRDELKKESILAGTELSDLGSSEQVSQLLADREFLLEELRELGNEWSRYSLALRMLETARSHNERERQPKLIQTASEFFNNITGSRYTSLRIPAGESKVLAVAADEEIKSAEQLSRGTREQMYLSLKMGAIQENSDQRLPVVVDDALVNSDPGRAAAAAEGIAKLAAVNQVLVFTCHPALVAQFQKAYPDAKVEKLGEPISAS